MALFRRANRGARGADGRKTTAGRPTRGKPAPSAPESRARAASVRRFFQFALWLLAGVAVMAGVGYLVAAIWLFPAPLLPGERAVPRVIGLSQREAARQLQRIGLSVTQASEPHPVAGAGLVTWQDPPPGVTVPRGATIRVVVSSGLPRAAVPNVQGMDLELAERVLGAVGLRVDGVDTVSVKARAPGTATGTTPSAGDSVPLGRGVIVHLAR